MNTDGYRDGLQDRVNGINLDSFHATALWRAASDEYKAEWSRGYEEASNLPTEALDEIVHDVASRIASQVCNDVEHLTWLLSQGWTAEEILDEVRRRTNEEVSR